ncbi:putative RNA-binding protein (virulence factor B family) [Chryseomicrobium aureum]|uniref:CvfB family protein n=1 Tax=Chryseomicrobium aureum TaxID=1441723 RepID=UPI00195E7663|nr:DNA-binding protein [Chryseomicrobium aureum]MBM7707017.1 putative RNA-binding protein (virulence factor B family) [Chryseomicrobium aureum]
MAELEIAAVVKVKLLEKEGSKWIAVTQDKDIVVINESEAIEAWEEGQEVSVFTYADRKGNILGSGHIPTIRKGTYGWAKVMKVTDRDGATVDIGGTQAAIVKGEDLPKLRELWPQPGDCIFMTLRTDRDGNLLGRLATEEKIEELYVEAPSTVYNSDIQARAYRLLPIGTFLLSAKGMYRIFVHQSERQAEPRLGEEVKVRIIEVKEDGTLNGSLLPRKQERLSDDAETVWRYLQSVGGKMPFGDKSTPDEIQEMFSMSKASFKRALGKLMKDGKIEQQDGWTLSKL